MDPPKVVGLALVPDLADDAPPPPPQLPVTASHGKLSTCKDQRRRFYVPPASVIQNLGEASVIQAPIAPCPGDHERTYGQRLCPRPPLACRPGRPNPSRQSLRAQLTARPRTRRPILLSSLPFSRSKVGLRTFPSY